MIIDLSLLGVFKYANFFLEGVGYVQRLFGGSSTISFGEILLPVGISFYTFQIISYVVDVYRQHLPARRSYFDVLLFTVYFPQLVAGPIERAKELIPRLVHMSDPRKGQMLSGMSLAFWGVFKKVFIADNLSPLVDMALFRHVDLPSGMLPLVASAFAFQVYADFSGYTDIARGISRMMGVELSLNFDLPFFASNPADFWKRWHITLGSFLRDYVYIPLGGNRFGPLRMARNVLVVWTLGGLWHGATFGFLIWGIYCGLLVILYGVISPIIVRIASFSERASKILTWIGRVFTFLTFGHGLLLFRVESPTHLWEVISNYNFSNPGLHFGFIGLFLFYISPLIVMFIFQYRAKKLEVLPELPWGIRLIAYSALGFLFVAFGSFQGSRFFYFQF